MKGLLMIIAAAGMLLLPSVALAETRTDNKTPSPIAQNLVREGDFGVDLAVVMKLGEPSTEAEAEDLLASAGITPKNGWIPDYPVTPDILTELEDTVAAAADAGTIPLGRDEALNALRGLALEYGLPLRSAEDEEYAEGSDDEEYYQPEVVEEYYEEYGPPVITYYSPPWDYWYLYSWVPYPFWWYGYWYPGYFILNDFTVVVNYPVHHHHHHHRDWSDRDGRWRESGNRVVSNRVRDADTRTFTRVDPVTRTGETLTARSAGHGRGLRHWSDTDRRGAQSILGRDLQKSTRRAGAVRGADRAPGQNRTFERATRLGDRDRVSRNVRRSARDGNAFRATRPHTSFGRPSRAGVTGTPARSFSRPQRSVNRSFGRPSVSAGRSFSRPSPPSLSTGRSFGRPSVGGRSFNAPSRAPSRSFQAPSGGGFGRGNSGFGRGGGCRGGRC